MPPNSWRFVGSPTGLSARIFKRHCMNAFRALFIFTDVDNERTLARFPLAARNEKAGESDAVALSSCNSDSRDIPLVLALGPKKVARLFCCDRAMPISRQIRRAREILADSLHGTESGRSAVRDDGAFLGLASHSCHFSGPADRAAPRGMHADAEVRHMHPRAATTAAHAAVCVVLHSYEVT
jgi:hypothetical protein